MRPDCTRHTGLDQFRSRPRARARERARAKRLAGGAEPFHRADVPAVNCGLAAQRPWRPVVTPLSYVDVRATSPLLNGVPNVNFTFRTCLAISLAAISTSFGTCALGAANDPFVGDWKLNPSKSKLTDEMKVESLATNKYSFDFEGNGVVETIVIDGTDQPGDFGTTLSITAEGPGAWKVVRKKDGRVLLAANWKLSNDGNTLRDDFSAISPNGTASTVNYVYKRTGRGSGFAGTWVSTSAAVNFVFVIQIRPYEGDGLSIINSSSLTRNVKLDGKDYRNVGPNAAIVATSSVRRLDAHTLELVDKSSNGKVYDTQKIKLSPDLNTLSMIVQNVGRTQRNILVFERQ